MQALGELIRQFLPLPRAAVMVVPGVGCGDLYPLCFHSSGRYHTERAWKQSTKVMYNIPGWRGLVREPAIMPRKWQVSTLLGALLKLVYKPQLQTQVCPASGCGR
jgi:hypothetical protein